MHVTGSVYSRTCETFFITVLHLKNLGGNASFVPSQLVGVACLLVCTFYSLHKLHFVLPA